MKRIIRFFAYSGGISLAILYSGTILAITPATAKYGFFTPPATDMTVRMLNAFYGVNYLGSGTDRRFLITVLFKYFNTGIFAIGILIITYTVVMAIVNSAHQGEFLGKKFDSVWVPVRSIAGMALIVPLPSGYSIAQILVLWLAIQGVGFADLIWNKTLRVIFQDGGAIISSFKPIATDTVPKTSTDPLIQNQQLKEGALFTYMTALQICTEVKNKQNPGSGTIKWRDISFNPNDKSKTQKVIQFGGNGADCKNSCGCIVLRPNATPADIDSFKSALNYLKYFSEILVTDPKGLELETLGESMNPFATLSYNLKMMPRDNYTESTTQLEKNIESFRKNGWGTAGIVYYQIAKNLKTSQIPQGNSISRIVDLDRTTGALPLDKYMEFYNSKDEAIGLIKNYMEINKLSEIKSKPVQSPQAVKDLPNITTPGLVDMIATVKLMADWIMDYGNSAGGELANIIKSANAYSINSLAGIITAGLTLATISNYNSFLSMDFSNRDPIIELAKFGNETLVRGVFGYMLALSLLSIAALLVSSMSCTLPFAWGLQAVIMLVTIPVFSMTAFSMIIGVFYALYLPLVPFLTYMFAIFNWYIMVFTAMTGAPIVVVALLYPDGHELYGKAEPGIFYIVTLTVLPVITLLAFIFAMGGCNLALRIFLPFFSTVSRILLDDSSFGKADVGMLYSQFEDIVRFGKLLVLAGIEAGIVGLVVNMFYGMINDMARAIFALIGIQYQSAAPANFGTDSIGSYGDTKGVPAAKSAGGLGESIRKSAQQGYDDKMKDMKEKAKVSGSDSLNPNAGGGGGDGGGDGGGGGGGAAGAGGGGADAAALL